MKQETTVFAYTGAFEISPEEIKDLSAQLQNIFEHGLLRLREIKVQMYGTEYSYESLDEFSKKHSWSSKVVKFSLKFCEDIEKHDTISDPHEPQWILISGGGVLDNYVLVYGRNPAWADGTRKFVREALNGLRPLHSRLTVPILPASLFLILTCFGLTYLLIEVLVFFLSYTGFPIIRTGKAFEILSLVSSVLATIGAFLLVGFLCRSRLRESRRSRLISGSNVILVCTVLMAVWTVLREISQFWP